ncbi:hypothetical protein [Flavobacterium sp. CS20]|jgi:hypothetical protein|uniref:hypothetical protein n=1 Tax=Flavobacterium sp. CS20 TaxID=2775246 RepID=UPI001B3A3F26|nr:hypothetical protein [Flavobacterium sp. CS20]QTY27790.1 hypothetical protein IGB25_04515 [Flavobacterium sp. CS20]
MKADKFTKIVLTIIAVNLTILTIKNLDLIPNTYANEPTKKLELAPNVNYGIVPVNEDGTISVKLSNHDEIDVNIVGVNTSDELNVNIDEIGGGYVSHGGPISVKIE